MLILYLLILRVSNNLHNVAFWKVWWVISNATLPHIILMDHLNNIFDPLIVAAILNGFNFPITPISFVVTIETPIICIWVIIIVRHMGNYPCWTPTLRPPLLIPIPNASQWRPLTESICHLLDIHNWGGVLHFHCTLLAGFMVWVEGSVVDTRHFILVRGNFLLRGVKTRTGDSHVVTGAIVIVVVRVLGFRLRGFLL